MINKFIQYTQLLKFFPRDGPGPLREFDSPPVAGSWKGSHTPVKGLFFWERGCEFASYPYLTFESILGTNTTL